MTKTKCCDNWICNDEHNYQLFSYARNCCSRNRRRYTLCGHHFLEEHDGDWRDCLKCRDSFKTEMYVYHGTNEYNFETLPNLPVYEPTKCATCGVTVNGSYINQRPHARSVQSGTAVAITQFVRTVWRDVAMMTLLSDPAPARTQIGRGFLPQDGFPYQLPLSPGVHLRGKPDWPATSHPLRNPSARGEGPTFSRSVARHHHCAREIANCRLVIAKCKLTAANKDGQLSVRVRYCWAEYQVMRSCRVASDEWRESMMGRRVRWTFPLTERWVR